VVERFGGVTSLMFLLVFFHDTIIFDTWCDGIPLILPETSRRPSQV